MSVGTVSHVAAHNTLFTLMDTLSGGGNTVIIVFALLSHSKGSALKGKS